MEDAQIVELYFERVEDAIKETDTKYGAYCYTIAYHILADEEDSEESVSDTYLAAWNTIPPRRPSRLAPYLGKITRNLSIDKWRNRTAEKRNNGQIPLALEELQQCISDGVNLEEQFTQKELIREIQKFLQELGQTERQVFVCRYWYFDSVSEIAKRFRFSESKVNSMLHRTRMKLKKDLTEEGLM